MALGGGTFLTQNKKLPGSYINFVSAARATASLSDRGYAAIPIPLDWGVDGEVFTVTAEDFQKDSLKIFGYDYTHAKLKGLRDLFKNIQTGYFYKLMKDGVTASNTFATAKHKGVRGNDLKTVIEINVDDITEMDVLTYLGSNLVDSQTVLPNTDNLLDTDYVTWKSNVVLTATVLGGLSMTLGANGDDIEGAEHQDALDKLEPYSFNTLGCVSTVPTIADLYVQFTKRLRDQVGVKFQVAVYRSEADYEGVINLQNDVTDDTNVAALIYWVTGIAAGVAVNKSNTNKKYDGEYAVNVSYKQSELEAALKAGKFILHKVGEDVRVLEDINSFTTFTVDKNEDFSSNQTIRVLDQIGNDIAVLFNTKYLGNVPNDPAGRISFWNDVVKHHQELEQIRAIEDFKADDVVVTKGETKKSVVVSDGVTPTNAMAQLYMTVKVS
ncbi:phage tail sheath family protein [Paenibacillus sp. FA6]|uniref:phage tail sheath family protein n=1 Tax=Paenibacillus sp. FA6 TaxID=3413029 RepID=UPI003F65CB5B